MLKNLFTKKNVYAALATVAVAVVGAVVAKNSRDQKIEIVVEDEVQNVEAPVVEDVSEEPVIKAKPANRQTPKNN